MTNTHTLTVSICTALAISMIVTSDAHAYLDPGTGSLLIQMLIASVVGAGVVIKIYWRKIRTFVGGLFGKTRDDV
jgi:hypothetical protein